MGTTINGIYIPAVSETGWGTLINTGLTNLANAHLMAQSLWVPAQSMTGDTTAESIFGTSPDAVRVIALNDAVTSAVYFTFLAPADYVTGTFILRPVWAPDATDPSAHTVRWQMNVKTTLGTDVRAAGTTNGWTGDSLAHTIGLGYRETGKVSTGLTPATGDIVRVALQRSGGSANDTFTANVMLIGVQIDYTAP